MLKAILVNSEIVFTDDENINTNELVTYDDLINYGCCYDIPEEMIMVKEGVIMTDDMNLIEIKI